MARGNEIIVSPEAKGRFCEGKIGAGLTPKPGTLMQIDYSVALVGGRHTWILYAGDADGGRPKSEVIVLLADNLQGRLATTAYAAAERAFGYVPQPGDELNLLIANVSGTATIAAGTVLIADTGTGKMIATTGSPETEMAVLQEAIVDNADDQLGWCVWTGY